MPASRRFDEVKPGVNSADPACDDENEVTFDDIAQVDQILRRFWQIRPETRENLAEHRHHFHQEENRDQNRHHRNDRGVHHGRFDLFAQPGRVFEVGRQPGQDFRQQAALFTRRHHANIQPIESLGVLPERLRKAVATLNPGANVANHVSHDLVDGLLRQGLQGLDHGQTSVNHRSQLARKHHQVVQWHFATTGFALFPKLLLD